MQRRDFLRSGAALAVAAKGGIGGADGVVPAHNWGNYDFGSGPTVTDRLNQGPFPQYPPDAVIPTDDVVMTSTPSDDVVPNYGKGLVTYITADMGTDEIKSDNIPQAIEDLVKFPLGQQLYIRPTWREIQPRPGRLELPEYLKLVFDLARKNGKRIGMRVQMCAPDYTHDAALPDFVLDKVPKVDLVLTDQREQASAQRYLNNPHSRYQPRYDHPVFQQAFEELVGLLAAEFNGNPQIEFIDTFMYGFWGEGHTWPFSNTPFPDYQTAERTWMRMLEVQLEHFTKTPLLTNTQPDYSRVGNAEMLDRTVRSNNWIRSDTIFIENEQIEALSNRPPWIAALLEQGLPGKPPDAIGRAGGHLSRGEHDRPRAGHRRKLLVALEFPSNQRAESAELLPGFARLVRPHQSPHRLSRQAVVYLELRGRGVPGDYRGLRERRHRQRPRRFARHHRKRRWQSAPERLPGSRLALARKDPPGAVCAAARNEIQGPEAARRARSQVHALSRPLGLPPEIDRGWLTHAAP